MKLILSIFIAYVAIIVLLIVFNLWWVLGAIYVLSTLWFIIEVRNAKEVPEDLSDLF